MQNRLQALSHWLQQIVNTKQFELIPLAGDASFRRYYRIHYNGQSQIVMDAPPDKESLHAFVTIAEILGRHQVRTPQIHAVEKNQGFAILDDLGDDLLLHALTNETADELYKKAIDALITLQSSQFPADYKLPIFNKQFICQELQLFTDWFLHAYLKLTLKTDEIALLKTTFDWLSSEINAQPQVIIHRDYHSRNIMLINDEIDKRLGIIDFQDAMQGPITYDLVSLLKDCYIQWPKQHVNAWLSYYYEQSTLAQQLSYPCFVRAFDLCGLQRHLKVLGIFSRLALRDNKPAYLKDLPLILTYVLNCLAHYEELAAFYQFVIKRIKLL